MSKAGVDDVALLCLCRDKLEKTTAQPAGVPRTQCDREAITKGTDQMNEWRICSSPGPGETTARCPGGSCGRGKRRRLRSLPARRPGPGSTGNLEAARGERCGMELRIKWKKVMRRVSQHSLRHPRGPDGATKPMPRPQSRRGPAPAGLLDLGTAFVPTSGRSVR